MANSAIPSDYKRRVASRVQERAVREAQRRVAENVRALAGARGISLSHISDFTGTSRSGLFALLRGAKVPTLRFLVQIASALGVDVAELLKPTAVLAGRAAGSSAPIGTRGASLGDRIPSRRKPSSK